MAIAIGQQLGTSNTNSYDPGQAGQAERVLNRPVVQQPDSESVLRRAPAGRAGARSAVVEGITSSAGVVTSAAARRAAAGRPRAAR